MLKRPLKQSKSESKTKVLKSIDQFLTDKMTHDEGRSSIKSRKSIRLPIPIVAEIYAPVKPKNDPRNSIKKAISMISISEKVKNHL